MDRPQVATEKPSLKRAFTRRKRLEQDLEHVTQEMYRRNLELAETNKTLSLLRQIDSLVLLSHDSLQTLANQIASAVAASTEYPFVALLAHLPHKQGLQIYGLNISETMPSEVNDALQKAWIATDEDWAASDEQIRTFDFQQLSPKELGDFLNTTDENAQLLHDKLGLHSVFMIKLNARGKLVGALAVGTLQPTQQITPHDQQLFQRLSEAVGVALDNKLLFEENQRVVKELQQTNAKLRALDEAKDEFISMASHQLRTPLTSVKGYVSMVLEGDAGKIAEMQRKLLDQAFVSSQRMVYLIADLLNVSRLRTGKFIIEAKPTNLADIVQDEVSQLLGTVEARKLELTYNKPDNFPALMLDETKTRQVVMNFIDNAIYYSPAGGKIEVAVTDKPDTVEFTVTDNGIGVPKAEQHHLFSKFYRAGNAKKARPDGTGLGLFMAKKVITAQGGAIIFKSEEGKGSTFGFTFSKAKLKTDAKPVTTGSPNLK